MGNAFEFSYVVGYKNGIVRLCHSGNDKVVWPDEVARGFQFCSNACVGMR